MIDYIKLRLHKWCCLSGYIGGDKGGDGDGENAGVGGGNDGGETKPNLSAAVNTTEAAQ